MNFRIKNACACAQAENFIFGSGRFVGLTDLVAVGVVLDVLHYSGIDAAALFDDHALALIVEHPDLRAGEIGIVFAENAGLVQAAELAFRAV